VAAYAIQKSCFGAYQNRTFELASVPVIAWVANEWKDKNMICGFVTEIITTGGTLCMVYK